MRKDSSQSGIAKWIVLAISTPSIIGALIYYFKILPIRDTHPDGINLPFQIYILLGLILGAVIGKKFGRQDRSLGISTGIIAALTCAIFPALSSWKLSPYLVYSRFVIIFFVPYIASFLWNIIPTPPIKGATMSREVRAPISWGKFFMRWLLIFFGTLALDVYIVISSGGDGWVMIIATLLLSKVFLFCFVLSILYKLFSVRPRIRSITGK